MQDIYQDVLYDFFKLMLGKEKSLGEKVTKASQNFRQFSFIYHILKIIVLSNEICVI